MDYVGVTDRATDDLSVAYSPNLNLQPVAPAVREIVDAAVADLAAAGATVDSVDVPLPPYEELSMAYVQQVGVFFSAFGQQVAAQYDVDFETADVEETVRATIELGAGTDATAERLQNVPRTAAYDGIEGALAGHDVLVTPALTVSPYSKHLADGYPTEIDGQLVRGVPTDAMLTWVFNLTGHPVASVPAGLTDGGLPVGLQIVGKRFAEADILSVAAALERVRPWMGHYPDAWLWTLYLACLPEHILGSGTILVATTRPDRTGASSIPGWKAVLRVAVYVGSHFTPGDQWPRECLTW